MWVIVSVKMYAVRMERNFPLTICFVFFFLELKSKRKQHLFHRGKHFSTVTPAAGLFGHMFPVRPTEISKNTRAMFWPSIDLHSSVTNTIRRTSEIRKLSIHTEYLYFKRNFVSKNKYFLSTMGKENKYKDLYRKNKYFLSTF